MVWLKLINLGILEKWEIVIKISGRSGKTNDIVGNSKLNDVNFKRIETDESNTNVV